MKWRPAALCFCILLVAAGPPSTAPAAQSQPGPAPASGQKVIKDQAEYDAYMKALALSDPAAKAAAFEAFLSTYPGSVMVPDALGQVMAAYQQAGEVAKVADAARRLLVLEPDDLRSLAVLAFVSRNAATKGDAAALADVRSYAERGLRALADGRKPDGVSDADYDQSRSAASAVLYGARGFSLLQAKHYPEARDAYLKALETGPDDVQDNYQLGIAEVQMEPLNSDGFWYLARAINLSRAQKNEVGAIAITTFAQRKYQSFHGSIDGWDAIRLRAGVSGPIPAGFGAGITRGPTPAEIAVEAVRDNDPKTLSIGDWEYVLTYRDASPANTAAAEKVWATIQATERGGAAMMAIPVTVVSSTAADIEASVSDENIKSHVADIHILLNQPLAQLPAAGDLLTATGVITSYDLHPFRFVMTKARLTPRSGDGATP